MTEPLGRDQFQQHLNVSRETLERLAVYEKLLQRWNRKINLVGASTLADFWRRHALDSAQLIDHLPQLHGRPPTILDMGSGAGFPGLVLAIMTAGPVHLVESDQRKAMFLREAARQTDANNVTVHVERMEKMTPFPVDVITARALAPLTDLLSYAESFFALSRKSGQPARGLFLKGENAAEEIESAHKKHHFSAKKIPSRSHPSAIILSIEPQGLVEEDS